MTERGLTYARHDSCPGISTIRDFKFEAVTQQPSSHTCVQGARRVRPACLMHGSPHRQRQLHLLRPRRVRAIRCGSASTVHALGQATLACLHARFACLHGRLHSQPAAPAHASRAHPHPTHIHARVPAGLLPARRHPAAGCGHLERLPHLSATVSAVGWGAAVPVHICAARLPVHKAACLPCFLRTPPFGPPTAQGAGGGKRERLRGVLCGAHAAAPGAAGLHACH